MKEDNNSVFRLITFQHEDKKDYCQIYLKWVNQGMLLRGSIPENGNLLNWAIPKSVLENSWKRETLQCPH